MATPLHLASRSARLAVAKLLIEKGANVEAKSSKGQTSFSLACQYVSQKKNKKIKKNKNLTL